MTVADLQNAKEDVVSKNHVVEEVEGKVVVIQGV